MSYLRRRRMGDTETLHRVPKDEGLMDQRSEVCVRRSLLERAEPVVAALCRRKLTVVTAESCTAGLVAAVLSHVPGAGNCLHGGFVAYSKQQKIDSLGVDPEELHSNGSVNPEVARQMARGALRHSAATVAVAVTGVLGPNPDEDGAKPGLFYVAVARTGAAPVVTERTVTGKTPDEVRYCAVEEALDQLLQLVRA